MKNGCQLDGSLRGVATLLHRFRPAWDAVSAFNVQVQPLATGDADLDLHLFSQLACLDVG